MALRNEICEIPKPVVTTWLRELRNPKYPVLPQGEYCPVNEATYIDGELVELFLYHSPDGKCYLTTNPD